MKMEQFGGGIKSYKDAVLAHLPSDYSNGPHLKPYVQQLMDSLRDLMTRFPNGVTLSQARRFCPLLLHPDVLKIYPSVRHLLASMSTIVRLQGVGVQTLLLPAINEEPLPNPYLIQ